jgi:hypothetical protein
MALRLCLLQAAMVSVAYGIDAATRDRHLAVMQRIPRVPLVILHKLVKERRLTIALSDLAEGVNIDCNADLSGTIVDFPDGAGAVDPPEQTMNCIMTMDGIEYELIENCTSMDEFAANMVCTICVDSADADNFDFCWQVACDFTSVEQTACTCTSARIDGELW